MKTQVVRMCNAFAYSVQVYARGSQEIRYFYDFLGLSKNSQREIGYFLRIRRTMLNYLSNTNTIDNVNLQVGMQKSKPLVL